MIQYSRALTSERPRHFTEALWNTGSPGPSAQLRARPGDDVVDCSSPSLLAHNAPFGDHGVGHLPGFLGAGDFVDLDRDFLADEVAQLRRLGIAVGDDLEGFRSGLQPAQSGRA